MYRRKQSTGQIAKQFDVSPATVRNILKRHGVPMRSLSEAQGGLTTAQEKKVCEMYRRKQSKGQIAKQFDVSPNTVHRTLKRHGVPMRSLSEARKLARRTTSFRPRRQRMPAA